MKQTVLVVEDDAATAGLIRDVLEAVGYRVLHRVDGEGVVAACRECPDVILLDVNMPGMDGPEVSQRLRTDPITAAIPIIAMSAAIGKGPLPDGMLADDRLTKPFGLAELQAAVERWTARS